MFLCSLALFMFHYCALFVRLVLLYVLTIAKTRQQILIKFKIKWQKKRWIVHKFCEEKSYATNACSLVRFNQFWTQKLIRFKVVPSTCRRSRSPSTAQFQLWVMEFFAVILHTKKRLFEQETKCYKCPYLFFINVSANLFTFNSSHQKSPSLSNKIISNTIKNFFNFKFSFSI